MVYQGLVVFYNRQSRFLGSSWLGNKHNNITFHICVLSNDEKTEKKTDVKKHYINMHDKRKDMILTVGVSEISTWKKEK